LQVIDQSNYFSVDCFAQFSCLSRLAFSISPASIFKLSGSPSFCSGGEEVVGVPKQSDKG
jgi:hypothetical protein